MKLKTLALAALAAAASLFPIKPARAASVECDQLSTGMQLCLPRYGTDGDQWGQAIIDAFTRINSSGVISSTYTIANMDQIYVHRIGGLSTGTANIRISSSVYMDSGTFFIQYGSMSVVGAATIGGGDATASGAKLVVGAGTGREFGFYAAGAASTMTLYGQTSGGANFAPMKIEASPLILNSGSLSNVAIGTHTVSSSQGQLYVYNNSARAAVQIKQNRDNEDALSIAGSTTTSLSKGLFLRGGTNSSDYALSLENASGGSLLLKLYGDGQLYLNGPATFASTVTITASNGANSNDAFLGTSVSNNNVQRLMIDNLTNTSGAGSSLLLQTGGGSAGDSYIQFNNRTINWSMGLDNSDSDKFKISYNPSLGTSDFLSIDSSGLLTATAFAGDGSGLTNIGGFAALTATQTWSGGNTFVSSVTINSGQCIGLSCRVGYSSGTLNTFSFILQSSETYRLEFNVGITTGTTATDAPFICTLNADATAGNYGNMVTSYADGYTRNNAGSTASWAMCLGGGSTFGPGEGCAGGMNIKNLFGSPTLIMDGRSTVVITAGSPTSLNTQSYSGLYVGASPWTIRCTPVAGVGWVHEAILYKVGK